MLRRAQVAVVRMHRQLMNAQHALQLPRISCTPFTQGTGLPARACRVLHEHRRLQTTYEGCALHAQSIKAEDHVIGNSFQHPQPLTLMEAREQMRSSVEPEAHRIAGVTFEGRQDAIQELQPGMVPFDACS